MKKKRIKEVSFHGKLKIIFDIRYYENNGIKKIFNSYS